MISHRGQTGEAAQPLLHSFSPSISYTLALGKSPKEGRVERRDLCLLCSQDVALLCPWLLFHLMFLCLLSPSVSLSYSFLLLTSADYGGGTPGSGLYFSPAILLRIGVLNTVPVRMTPRVSS